MIAGLLLAATTIASPVVAPGATSVAAPVRAGMGGHAVQAQSRLLPDLPVMPGLWESGSGFAFPLARGARLAETRLLGRVGDTQVQAYYARALLDAGWRQQAGAPYLYRRGRERLVLRVGVHRAGGGVLTEALFVVTPEDASASRSPR